jgi:pilus assembly protein CpaC
MLSPSRVVFVATRLALAALVLLASIPGETAAQVAGSGISSHGRSGGLAIDIPINKSDVIRSERPFYEVAVGNPEIADVQVLGDQALYIFGRQFGATSVTLSGEDGRIIAVVDVNVTHDIARLKEMLHALLPQEQIAVRAAHDGIVLSGEVTSASAASSAVTIAERFAPNAVSNLMQVGGTQQVMLAVRFVEMRRDTVKRLGINATGAGGGGALTLFGDIAAVVASPPSLAQFGFNVLTGSVDFTAFLDLLEEKGIARTLAEPTLVALSGDTADFLAGGEFPVPVGAENGEVKIEFKNYGVGLTFTPTVLNGDLLNVQLFMEVSEPDEASDFELLGIRIPGLVVRRATTTIELRSGQSFAIAGLLSESFTDQVKQLPFVGDIPVLGALTRSTQYTTGQTELVMIVTPWLVQPVDGSRLRTPGFSAPSEKDLFLSGKIESNPGIDPGLHGSAGLSGPHGYSSW